MRRQTEDSFCVILGAVRSLPPDQREAIAYCAALALQHARFGNAVYVHVGAPVGNIAEAAAKVGLSVLMGPYGRAGRSNKRHVHIGPSATGLCWYTEGRLRRLLQAAQHLRETPHA